MVERVQHEGNPWLAASNAALVAEVARMSPRFGAVFGVCGTDPDGKANPAKADLVYLGAPVAGVGIEDVFSYILQGPEELQANPNASLILSALGQRMMDIYTPQQAPEGGRIHG